MSQRNRGTSTTQPVTAMGAVERPGPPHLSDPRALTILTTEHWSLLSARALVYNESFARTGMLLTVLSASLVALALVAQAMGFGDEFLVFAAFVLGFDLFLALATLGRIGAANRDDLRYVQAMNRIRHAYLELAPELEAYFSTSRYDDMRGVLATYGEPIGKQSMLVSFAHGMTTMDGMVGVITAIVAGVLAGIVAAILGATAGSAALVGLAGIAAVFAAISLNAVRSVFRFQASLQPRFPSPDEPADA